MTALLGLGLGGIYWFTGSLLVAIVIHVVLDARQAFALSSRSSQVEPRGLSEAPGARRAGPGPG